MYLSPTTAVETTNSLWLKKIHTQKAKWKQVNMLVRSLYVSQCLASVLACSRHSMVVTPITLTHPSSTQHLFPRRFTSLRGCCCCCFVLSFPSYFRFSRVRNQVKLGGNKASGAKRMYFVLLHAIGGQQGRISAPPTLANPLLVPPSPRNTEVVTTAPAAAHDPNPFGESASAIGGGGDGSRGCDELSKSGKRKGGVIVESNDDQIFHFWDDKANGKLVQAPLDLDRHGRGWCEVGCLRCVWV